MLCHKENITNELNQTSSKEITKWLEFVAEQQRWSSELIMAGLKSEKALELTRSKLKLPFKGGHKKRTPLKISNMAGTVVTSVTTISSTAFQRTSDQNFMTRMWE